jgi:hypothetical protein
MDHAKFCTAAQAMVHAGFGKIFSFVAALLPQQARRGPRVAASRNAIAHPVPDENLGGLTV